MKAYYESESEKRLLIRKKLCFEEIAGQLQAIISNCIGHEYLIFDMQLSTF